MSLLDGQWIYYLLQCPYYLALLVAGIMCVSNHSRNPRGATLLGLGVLLNLAASGIWWLYALAASNSMLDFGIADPTVMLYGLSFVSSLLHAGSWILAALAVFARSRHEATDFFHADG